jgi:hypothetical protein
VAVVVDRSLAGPVLHQAVENEAVVGVLVEQQVGVSVVAAVVAHGPLPGSLGQRLVAEELPE